MPEAPFGSFELQQGLWYPHPHPRVSQASEQEESSGRTTASTEISRLVSGGTFSAPPQRFCSFTRVCACWWEGGLAELSRTLCVFSLGNVYC